MIKTFKTEFKPSAHQKAYLSQAFGVRRWTWNWAVSLLHKQAPTTKFPSVFELQKQLNNTLVKDPTYSWLSAVNSMVRSEALKDFGLSLKAAAVNRHKSKCLNHNLSPKKYMPTFQKKGICKDSARLHKKGGYEFSVCSAHKFSCVTTHNQSRLVLNLRENISFLQDADIKTCTFSRCGGRYFLSITYEKTNHKQQTKDGVVGIDLGIMHVATCYDQDKAVFVLDVPSTLRCAEKHTERINRLLARSKVDSNRHARLLFRLQRSYLHETNIKKDCREKFTTMLVKSYKTIKIDDFNFESAKKLDVNRSLYRVGAYQFKLRLEQKAADRSCKVVYVPEGTSTTKTCSHCGNVQDMKLADRTYVCAECGNTLDRDLNSAINVFKLQIN